MNKCIVHGFATPCLQCRREGIGWAGFAAHRHRQENIKEAHRAYERKMTKLRWKRDIQVIRLAVAILRREDFNENAWRLVKIANTFEDIFIKEST